MLKDHVGLIHCEVEIGNENAALIRFYRDGTILRDGAGGLPPIYVEAQYRAQQATLFHQLLDVLPAALLEKPVVWQSPEPMAIPVSFKVLCYSQNLNHGIGADAEWGDMCGLRVHFDLRKTPSNALVALADKLINAAKALSNRSYFDLLVYGATQYRSSILTDGIKINALDNSPKWLSDALGRYIIQLRQLNPEMKIEEFTKGKFYTSPEGQKHIMQVAVTNERFGYRFVPM